jgi:hypothetical protein
MIHNQCVQSVVYCCGLRCSVCHERCRQMFNPRFWTKTMRLTSELPVDCVEEEWRSMNIDINDQYDPV